MSDIWHKLKEWPELILERLETYLESQRGGPNLSYKRPDV